jgi:AcrR family transcriptional regulator
MPATDSRRSRWGSEIPVAIVQDFIRTGLRHEAVADFIAEYVFDALASDGQAPAELGEALRLAFTEIIEASSSADWQRVGDDLVADARENLEAERDSLACAPLPDVVRPSRLRRRTTRLYQPDGPHARSRRGTADLLLDALEKLREENPGQRLTLRQVATRATLAKETIFVQFGRTAGLYWTADARAATRLPALWAEVGFAEPGTPLRQIRGAAQEYLRLALAHPGPMRALLQPETLDELLRPKDPRSYRTLTEYRAALAHRVAEQDRRLTLALAALVGDESVAREVVHTLNRAWLRVAAQAWQLGSPDHAELSQEIAERTATVLSKLNPMATKG